MSFLCFFNNLRYLARYNLKSIYKTLSEGLSDDALIDQILYEIGSERLEKPDIKNIEDTLSDIISNKASIARFGDGEYAIIWGKDIPFQEYNRELASRLKKILTNGSNPKCNLYVGIPHLHHYRSEMNLTPAVKSFIRTWVAKNRERITALTRGGVEYYASEITQVYQLCLEYDFTGYFNKFCKIWENRKLLIVCGDRVFKNIHHNIFDNGASVEYLHIPSKNAYSQYNKILAQIETYSTDTLIGIIAGPTAAAMASELAEKGYQALDLGHIAKDYNSYKLNEERTEENIKIFFSPD